MTDETELGEVFISAQLEMKTDGHLIHLKRHPSYKSDTMIISMDELERIMEIARMKAKVKFAGLMARSKFKTQES